MKIFSITSIFIICAALSLYQYGRSIWAPLYQQIVGKETIESVISKYGPGADSRMVKIFSKAGISYPPKSVKFLAMKEEKSMEIWAKDNGDYRYITTYRIKGTSGISGPKLIEGDKQVPEGFYRIIGLNPNSSYHLSMKINYPSELDLKHAKVEGRENPGSNIFIHGKSLSIGCLAMGDRTIEDLFTLVYRVGISNTGVIISPHDPRKRPLITNRYHPKWLPSVYGDITDEFSRHDKHGT